MYSRFKPFFDYLSPRKKRPMPIPEFKKYAREWLMPLIEGANEDPEADAAELIIYELRCAIQKLEG